MKDLNNKKIGHLAKFILGNQSAGKGTLLYKRLIITGQLCLLVASICLIYLIFDIWIGVYFAIPYYIVLFLLSITAFLLNQKGKHLISRLLIFSASLSFIFLFTSSEPVESGNYFNFFPLAISPFLLFGYERFKLSLFLSITSLSLFGIALFSDFSMLPNGEISTEINELNFFIHFIVAMLATLFMVITLAGANFKAEEQLRKNEKELLHIRSQLEENTERLAMAISGANAGVYDWDIKKNTIQYSILWKKLLGYRPEEIKDEGIDEFMQMVHPDDAEKVNEKIHLHLTQNERYSEVFRLKTKQGNYRWFLDAGQATWDNEGKPIRMVGALFDITEKKLTESTIREQNTMLEKINAELDRFLYSTSHDLRAPLMSILGILNVAENTNKIDELKEYMQLIGDRTHKLDEYINEIIDYTRNHRQEVRREIFNLHALVSKSVANATVLDPSGRINFQIEIPENLFIKSDYERWHIILKSLLSNAVKHHNYKNQYLWVKIYIVDTEETFEMYIEDNGKGIKKEYQDRIFDMFFKASEDASGSGIGLYLVKEALNRLAGDIELKSNYGDGTSLCLKFKVPEQLIYLYR
ncbi:MAG: PAS domain-containing protein [Cyclobacteriaceae bacterium]|nr:PAS domain-containing protein [Cyclobacteriaceae bacterium]